MRLSASTLAIAASLSLASITSVVAADLPAQANMPLKAPPYTPVSNWTGFYVGAHIGYGWGTDDGTRVNANTFFPAGFAESTTNLSGVEGGGQFGFNYEVSRWVLGVEGNFGAADINGSASDTNILGAPGVSTHNFKIQWVDDVTGRVGYDWNNWLFYGKGGWAWAGTSANVTNTAVGAPTSQGNDTLNGWTAGGGIEWMFLKNWSAKAEYQHFDFGTQQVNRIASTGFVNVVNSSLKTDLVRVGVNYHFWSW
jgi:outer membrane immunogenic protein